jgi:hypothetical protein
MSLHGFPWLYFISGFPWSFGIAGCSMIPCYCWVFPDPMLLYDCRWSHFIAGASFTPIYYIVFHIAGVSLIL